MAISFENIDETVFRAYVFYGAVLVAKMLAMSPLTGLKRFVGQVDDRVFGAYVFWSAVLVAKMLAMSSLTSLARVRNSSFANPEDASLVSKKLKPRFNDESVERIRRAHRNDLENILPFFVIGFFYMLTNPLPSLAINLFRTVAAARILHTIVYAIVVIPQPARVLAFAGGLAPTIYMTVQTILYFK